MDSRGCIRPGYILHFNALLMDSRSGRIAPTLSLRDAAGHPVTLVDEQTGQRMKLNADLIAAIEAEAVKAGLSIERYVKEVLRFSQSSAALAGQS